MNAIETIMAHSHQCSVTFMVDPVKLAVHSEWYDPLSIEKAHAMAKANAQIEQIIKDAENYTVSYGKWYTTGDPDAVMQIYVRDFDIRIHG